MNYSSVAGKTVVITGGSGVLGSSMAHAFAKAKAKLVVLGMTDTKIKRTVAELQTITADVIGVKANVLNPTELHEAKETILNRFGQIDILINAAGGNTPKATQPEGQSIFDLNLPDIDFAIDLNLKGAIYPSLIFGEAMAKTGRGSIINISSMATYSAITRVMGYSVGKSGVNSFTQWLACELADKFGDKVRVNAIAPGFFLGDQNRRLLLNEDGTLTPRSKKVIQKTPMRRFGDIKELNGLALFLSSDAASFITGTIIPVDGGFSACSGV
ncbi:SDR family oxidoreductase [Marinoscillum furvescens]|uniref:NAD(P)-dependent dehydrogenase (Short-subunit alcohol dehydrogenase family) n=1 Tax=Marinoscillum furvescens DSM 4134 TaxID=1122208 RepID=A0A3D9LAD1_MARFU|nr:SDR family oxidoreductase [Marinoscillum furvescens]REE02203.1 NAD(P)-dependent dehydrogenase (short-subunit alcohol dehydrogenase family) [Marinoscillum furvescens DSM 4134]